MKACILAIAAIINRRLCHVFVCLIAIGCTDATDCQKKLAENEANCQLSMQEKLKKCTDRLAFVK